MSTEDDDEVDNSSVANKSSTSQITEDLKNVITAIYKEPVKTVERVNFPTHGTKDAWISDIIANVAIAVGSGNDEDESIIKWVKEVESKQICELRDTGNRNKLDAELLKMLEKTLVIDRVKKDRKNFKLCATKGTAPQAPNMVFVPKARQLMRFILDYLDCDDHSSLAFTFKHVDDIQWYGDSINDIDRFLRDTDPSKNSVRWY